MLYTFMLKLSKKELDRELKSNDGYKLSYRLICFINIIFSIREKFNIIKEQDNILCGLKRFYNITKHYYCPRIIFNSLCLPSGEERNVPVFMDISEINKFNKQTFKIQEQSRMYDQYIKDKTIKSIVDYVFDKTIELLKNNNYI